MTINDLTPEEMAAREAKLELWRGKEADAQKNLAEQLDLIIPYLSNRLTLNSNMRNHQVSKSATPEAEQKIIDMGIPKEGIDTTELFDVLVNDVLEYGMMIQHPRFLSYVTSTVSPISLGAAVLSDAYNLNGAAYDFAPMAVTAENQVISWMCSRLGWPAETCGGVFVSGGSMANFTGQIAARDNMLKEEEWGIATAYFSNQTHASTERGLHMGGLRKDQIVKIDVDDEYRIRTDLLVEAIERDIAAGKKPYLIIGNMGTTNTGTIDPLEELADIAEKYGMWLHVDGAFGGTTMASDKYRVLGKGIERANSMAWDGHKWLMQTYSCSTILVRDKQTLVNAFSTHPEYLVTILEDAAHIGPMDLGPEMSRPVRGVKLWATLQSIGTDNISTLVGKAWHMTKAAKEEFELLPGWEIMCTPCCGTIAFRYVPEGWTDLEKINALNARISERTIAEGYAYVAITTLKGMTCMRLNMINVTTTDEDVRSSVAFLQQCAEKELAAL